MRRSRSVAQKATKLTLEDEIAHLRDLDIHGLQIRWKGVFRREPSARLARHLLFAMVAYQLQAEQLGDLAPDTVRLLRQIAAAGGITQTVRLTSEFDRRRAELKSGTILMRDWNGQPHRVMVLDEAFAWNGKTYDSLSKIACAITGTKWNGPRFFGLRDKSSIGPSL